VEEVGGDVGLTGCLGSKCRPVKGLNQESSAAHTHADSWKKISFFGNSISPPFSSKTALSKVKKKKEIQEYFKKKKEKKRN